MFEGGSLAGWNMPSALAGDGSRETSSFMRWSSLKAFDSLHRYQTGSRGVETSLDDWSAALLSLAALDMTHRPRHKRRVRCAAKRSLSA
jgi:hypothetical protein